MLAHRALCSLKPAELLSFPRSSGCEAKRLAQAPQVSLGYAQETQGDLTLAGVMLMQSAQVKRAALVGSHGGLWHIEAS